MADINPTDSVTGVRDDAISLKAADGLLTEFQSENLFTKALE